MQTFMFHFIHDRGLRIIYKQIWLINSILKPQ